MTLDSHVENDDGTVDSCLSILMLELLSLWRYALLFFVKSARIRVDNRHFTTEFGKSQRSSYPLVGPLWGTCAKVTGQQAL